MPLSALFNQNNTQNPPSTEPDPDPTPTPIVGNPNIDLTAQIVPGSPAAVHQMNIADYAGQVVTDPTKAFITNNPDTAQNESMFLQDHLQGLAADPNAAGTNIDPNAQQYQMDPDSLQAQQTQGQATTAAQTDAQQAQGYDAALATPAMQDAEMQAATLGHDQVDPRATVQGQMHEIQSQFTDPVTGKPTIPPWATAQARQVQKTAAFKGMTGTAATAAMSQAMLESSLPIAMQDADTHRQLMFQNLNHEQQAAVLNTQNRAEAILSDQKAVNTARLFEAQSQNEMTKFYDELGASIERFNAAQINEMSAFNAQEANAISKFNQELEDSREKFYREMAFNIDVANAKWRQEVTLTNNQQAFDAAATDVRNLLGMSVEQANQLWDRSDALLDYLWKSSENELERDSRLAIAKLQADTALSQTRLQGQMQADAASAAGWGQVFGTIAGAGANAFFNWLF